MGKPQNSLDDWIEIFNNKHKDKYDYSLLPPSFTGKDIIDIICPDHGKFQLIAANHRRGNGCKICSGFKRYTEKEYINDCNRIHNNKYNYSKIIFNGKDKLEIICPIHGSFFQDKFSHKNGIGCPQCGKEKVKKPRKDVIYYINKFISIHGDTYDYSKFTKYVRVWNNIEIICKTHGQFFQSIGNHLLGHGCPQCAKDKFYINPRNKKNTDYAINNFKKVHNDKYDYSKVDYKHNKEIVEIICKTHGSFFQTPNSHQTGNGCPICSQSGKSKAENEISKLIPENLSFTMNNRKFIGPKEIDILIEEKKFGIEYNGIMNHSYGLSNSSRFNNYHLLNKNKHLNKTLLMEEKDFQLFHIKDFDWNNPIKKEIWKSIINNKLGNSVKLFARKLKIIDLTNYKTFVKDFLNTNHLQGSCGYRYAYGLCNNKNEVYSIMTFGKSRFNKNIEYELLRFCNIKNVTIVGGASKLLKYFERIIKPQSIISYANRDWSQGNLYKQLNFEFIDSTPPNYFYIDINGSKIISRIMVQKHKLKEFLGEENFDENLSERDNMINNGYRIYYDTGNLSFQKIYKGN